MNKDMPIMTISPIGTIPGSTSCPMYLYLNYTSDFEKKKQKQMTTVSNRSSDCLEVLLLAHSYDC